VRLLDAFAYFRFDLGSRPAEIRLGSQVVSWGESTFIQGGINAVNHFDVSALRAPGAELKEGFMPQEMAFVSLGIRITASKVLSRRLGRHRAQAVGSISHQRFRADGIPGIPGLRFPPGRRFSPLGGPFITNSRPCHAVRPGAG
jgi:hypothetical protein